ncbi:hypothetical protein K5549_001990 [Capra hircus]|nr:hypothetical protein K5549_001990 [Capra hircus]
MQKVDVVRLASLSDPELRLLLPCLVRMALCAPADQSQSWAQDKKLILRLLSGVEAVNSIVALLSVDFHALEQDASKEQQLRPTEEEAEQLLQLMTSRPPATPAGVRFVSLSFCMLLAFSTLVSTPEQEQLMVVWLSWMIKEEAYFESTSGVSASFGEMLLLVAMYFHSNQLSAIIDLVCSTLGMKVVTAHAVRVPVTSNLSANITGFLPIHCIYQLLRSRSFTKHKVSIKGDNIRLNQRFSITAQLLVLYYILSYEEALLANAKTLVNALQPSIKFVRQQKYTQNDLMIDPLIVLRCDQRVYRCPPLMDITLHMLNGYLLASKAYLSAHLKETAEQDRPSQNNTIGLIGQTDGPEVTREELKNALLAAQDSAAVQILLEICLPTEEEKAKGVNPDSLLRNVQSVITASTPNKGTEEGEDNLLCNLREVQCLICCLLHQMYIADPNIAKLVHFQVWFQRMMLFG